MTARALALLLLLTACAGTPSNPDEAACQSRVNDDPTVKMLIIKGTGSPVFQNNSQAELNAAKQDALVACLRARGILRPGGVERQKPLR